MQILKIGIYKLILGISSDNVNFLKDNLNYKIDGF